MLIVNTWGDKVVCLDVNNNKRLYLNIYECNLLREFTDDCVLFNSLSVTWFISYEVPYLQSIGKIHELTDCVYICFVKTHDKPNVYSRIDSNTFDIHINSRGDILEDMCLISSFYFKDFSEDLILKVKKLLSFYNVINKLDGVNCIPVDKVWDYTTASGTMRLPMGLVTSPCMVRKCNKKSFNVRRMFGLSKFTEDDIYRKFCIIDPETAKFIGTDLLLKDGTLLTPLDWCGRVDYTTIQDYEMNLIPSLLMGLVQLPMKTIQLKSGVTESLINEYSYSCIDGSACIKVVQEIEDYRYLTLAKFDLGSTVNKLILDICGMVLFTDTSNKYRPYEETFCSDFDRVDIPYGLSKYTILGVYEIIKNNGKYDIRVLAATYGEHIMLYSLPLLLSGITLYKFVDSYIFLTEYQSVTITDNIYNNLVALNTGEVLFDYHNGTYTSSIRTIDR